MRVAVITDTHYGARKGSTHLHNYFQLFYDNIFFLTLEREKIDVERLVSSTKTFLYLLATVPFLAFVILITASRLEIAVGGYCLVVIILICWFFVFTKKAGLR